MIPKLIILLSLTILYCKGLSEFIHTHTSLDTSKIQYKVKLQKFKNCASTKSHHKALEIFECLRELKLDTDPYWNTMLLNNQHVLTDEERQITEDLKSLQQLEKAVKSQEVKWNQLKEALDTRGSGNWDYHDFIKTWKKLMATGGRRACPRNYINIYNYCLHFSEPETGTWYDMLTYCLYNGGTLLKINDANLLYEINNFIRARGMNYEGYWLGGSKQEEAQWKWTDGSPVKMGQPFWSIWCDKSKDGTLQPSGSPGEDCLAVWKNNFAFDDAQCIDFELVAICEAL